jgi:hypothetical protein
MGSDVTNLGTWASQGIHAGNFSPTGGGGDGSWTPTDAGTSECPTCCTCGHCYCELPIPTSITVDLTGILKCGYCGTRTIPSTIVMNKYTTDTNSCDYTDYPINEGDDDCTGGYAPRLYRYKDTTGCIPAISGAYPDCNDFSLRAYIYKGTNSGISCWSIVIECKDSGCCDSPCSEEQKDRMYLGYSCKLFGRYSNNSTACDTGPGTTNDEVSVLVS